jgi:hypothetical protein
LSLRHGSAARDTAGLYEITNRVARRVDLPADAGEYQRQSVVVLTFEPARRRGNNAAACGRVKSSSVSGSMDIRGSFADGAARSDHRKYRAGITGAAGLERENRAIGFVPQSPAKSTDTEQRRPLADLQFLLRFRVSHILLARTFASYRGM